ncbi:unnamed protein product, partial [Urochloa humidicola]
LPRPPITLHRSRQSRRAAPFRGSASSFLLAHQITPPQPLFLLLFPSQRRLLHAGACWIRTAARMVAARGSWLGLSDDEGSEGGGGAGVVLEGVAALSSLFRIRCCFPLDPVTCDWESQIRGRERGLLRLPSASPGARSEPRTPPPPAAEPNPAPGAILRHAYTVLQEYSNVLVQGYNTLFVFVLPDWGYQISGGSIEKSFSVKCGVRGDTAPACNAVGMVGFRDRPSLQTVCLRAYKGKEDDDNLVANPMNGCYLYLPVPVT